MNRFRNCKRTDTARRVTLAVLCPPYMIVSALDVRDFGAKATA